MTTMIEQHYLDDSLRQLRKLKAQADKAVAQTADEHFFSQLDLEANSIALVMKHVAGNMRSRWTDFLTSDGEKPDRNRDLEFQSEGKDRRQVTEAWEDAWFCFFNTLDSLEPEDLTRTITIRREPYIVVAAINRQLEHYGYHVGQIVFLAKHFKSLVWRSLSIPRAASATFNEAMREKYDK